MEPYLQDSEFIDWQVPAIRQLAAQLSYGTTDTLQIAKACFEYVRDHIHHSWDYRQNPVTLKASDVLRHGTGYCYAKSHLLAALLRANAIPAALCYQRLTITEVPPFCWHGLNAVWLPSYGWYRVDARGNKPGVQAEFTPPVEHLAFELLHPGECDVPGFYAEPHPIILRVLQSCASVQEVFERLPETDVRDQQASDICVGAEITT